MQPDVYCRRLSLQAPIAVSVRTGQTADVFHAVCRVAMNPCVDQSVSLLARCKDSWQIMTVKILFVWGKGIVPVIICFTTSHSFRGHDLS